VLVRRATNRSGGLEQLPRQVGSGGGRKKLGSRLGGGTNFLRVGGRKRVQEKKRKSEQRERVGKK